MIEKTRTLRTTLCLAAALTTSGCATSSFSDAETAAIFSELITGATGIAIAANGGTYTPSSSSSSTYRDRSTSPGPGGGAREYSEANCPKGSAHFPGRRGCSPI
jgi:hypothetical protein